MIAGDVTEPYCQVSGLLLSHSGRQTDGLKQGLLSTAFLCFYGLHRVKLSIALLHF